MSAIFKFNNGQSALLCSNCRKIIKKAKDYTLEELAASQGQGNLAAQYCEACSPKHAIYTLTRLGDGMTVKGTEVKFVRWNEDGTFKAFEDNPSVGTSCIINPQLGRYFTWLTTIITEITEHTDRTLKFKTQNSEYTLQS
jgi:hypothetical protein